MMPRPAHPFIRTASMAAILAGVFLSGTVQAQTKRGPIRDLSKGNTLYVVPYAHLDTQWRWAYPQVIREYIANTLHRNFDLIEKYPNYVFNFSGSRRYEMMKEYYPADYERLKGYIKAGRWFPCGSSVDEGDANVPSAESLVRHVLYGNHYFRKEFGVASDEFMLPDCFGFPYALPSVLVHCGVKGFSTQKLTWGSAVGIPFKVGTWEGPDGKSIVAALDPGSYSADVSEDLSQNTSWLARIQNTGRISGAYTDYHYYGIGDQGGSPREPAVNWVEKSIAGKGPITVVSAQADEMFRSLTPGQIGKLPHYKGELLLTEHSAGSVTSQAYMKRWNRKSELLADAAEKASVAAMWLGSASYPSHRLYTAWDLILGSQMHDMLPGTSIPKAYEYCWNDYLLAQNMLASVTTDAVGAVANSMDTRGDGQSLVVYNPLSIAREDVVEATLSNPFNQSLRILGPDGKEVPSQVLSTEKGLVKVLFLAKAPSTGFAVYHAVPGASSVAGKFKATLKASGNQIESPKFRVTINRDGDIGSIYDKAAKREVLKAPARLELQYHNPSAFPAWNMDWDDAKLPPMGVVSGPAKVRIVENGPVRVAIEVERESFGSKFVQIIRLSAGSAGDKVEVENKIDWQTKEVALKASFPLTTGNPEATYDLQLGAIKRGNNDPKKYEVPQHQWFDLTNPSNKYGVGILNDSKFGSDKPNDDTVRLTLIYTPGVRSGYEDQATQDFGRHDIVYAIQPHTGDWRKGQVPWEAKRLNQPLKAFAVAAHPGKLGREFSIVNASSNQVEIEALKKAEDSNEVIVRLREIEGRPAKNVRISMAGGITSAREVNGQEQPVGPATVQKGALVATVPGFSLKAYALKLGTPSVMGTNVASKPLALPYNVDVASTDKNPKDGAFNGKGQTIAAEQLPSKLTVDGINFSLGSTKDRAKNAVAAMGQKITIPAGYSRVYLLAAADGDQTTTFGIGKRFMPTKVADWGGFIGQWDNRLWAQDPGPNFSFYRDMAGLVPAYEKGGEVAWYSSHRHNPTSGNEFYEYSYLFKYGFDVPAGGTTLTLPKNGRIKVFAISAAKSGHDAISSTMPLYDNLTDHGGAAGAPQISPSAGTYHDVTKVTVTPPLYWRNGGLRYTVDGSTPTAKSPAYKGSITIADPSVLKVAEVDSTGKVGPVAVSSFNVLDETPPTVVQASTNRELGFARVQFSEEVSKASAQTASNYQTSGGETASSAHLSPDGTAVEVAFRGRITGDKLKVANIRDLTKAGNKLQETEVPLTERGPVFTSPALEPKTSKRFQEASLPVKASAPWTINLFCKIDSQPEDRTLIGGFGRSLDGRSGTGRYFSKFPEGINFWICNKDVQTHVPLDLGRWQMLTATYDGKTVRLYKNGEKIGEQVEELADDQAQVNVMPLDAWERIRRFNGDVREFTVWDQDLSPLAIRRLWSADKK